LGAVAEFLGAFGGADEGFIFFVFLVASRAGSDLEEALFLRETSFAF